MAFTKKSEGGKSGGKSAMRACMKKGGSFSACAKGGGAKGKGGKSYGGRGGRGPGRVSSDSGGSQG